MSRVAIADRDDLRRGAWTAEEDEKLRAYVGSHGTGHWRSVGRKAGLQRCGKSCRLRWTNYLRPNIRHGSFTPYEEDLIVKLHSSLGSRWSLIAARMPGRTDNDIKNHWNTRLKKKLLHNFLSDHYGDHQLVPCSWRTTSSMNAATAAAAAAGTSTTSSSAASTLQVDELAAAVQLLPCSSNKLQEYAVPMSSSRFSTDESNLQLHIIKQHQQQPYFNFSDTFDMDLMKTRPHHIPMDQRQQQQQQEEDHHVENSMISRHEYYNNQINPAGLNFNQLQVTSDLELPAAGATGQSKWSVVQVFLYKKNLV
ncbi:unnamed protein product [Sphagnum troendelagicum]